MEFKAIRYFISCFLATAALCAVQASGEGGDPWLRMYKTQNNTLYTSTIYGKNEQPIKFFNGFSIGASAGVGLFHGDLAPYRHLAPLDEFSKYYKFGWRVHAERLLWKGLGAKLLFEKGTLAGGRQTGLQSIPIRFESQYNTLSLLGTFDVLGAVRKGESKLDKTKIFLNAEAGIGITWYRALSFWTGNDERIREFIGYTVTDYNPPTQRYTADAKDKAATALNFPVGFTFGYRMNYKTDLTFSYILNNLATDRLDTFSRDWTARDKYSFFGIGLRYNFNREDDQYPDKKKSSKASRKNAAAAAADQGEPSRGFMGIGRDNVSPREVKLGDPVQARRSKNDGSQRLSDMEEIRMKMFELQLKLFQMQYFPEAPLPNK